MQSYTTYYQSPLGTLELIGNEQGLQQLNFTDSETIAETQAHNSLQQTIDQLDEYFQGNRQDFELKLNLEGTPFQKQVWSQLAQIPYGETVSYKHIAQNIDNPRAVRAVGGANGRNPIAIIIPCHRVIAADGQLGGYSSGLPRKKWLLSFEQNKNNT